MNGGWCELLRMMEDNVCRSHNALLITCLQIMLTNLGLLPFYF